MPKPILTLAFPKQHGPDDPVGYHHRVKNFAEDLRYELETLGNTSLITDIDAYFKELKIEFSKRRYLPRSLVVVERMAQTHNLWSEIQIDRE